MDPQHTGNDHLQTTIVTEDSMIAELLSMGFDISAAAEAVRTEGIATLGDAVEFLLAGGCLQCETEAASTGNGHQPPLLVSASSKLGTPAISGTENLLDDLCTKAEGALSKHFGHSRLKPFQLEALKAWATHQDCLVLAATGSGKSLCFQLPALLTGKVVVVISPLISLMHDQCLQLTRRGITACFLGSGQVDKSVEKKAMDGLYSIVYVCPETLPRLMSPLKELACKRGIALFAIDEAHCISKWGHDFRPDYRRLSALRETFQVRSLPGLKDHIPIMGLTATATTRVQEDILNSLKIDSSMAKIVRTTLFRPNLRFSVRHSKTCKPSSYEKDFRGLIEYYSHGSGSNSHFSHCSRGDTNMNSIATSRPEKQIFRGDQGLPYGGHNKQSGIPGKNEQVGRHLEVEDLEMDGEHAYPNEIEDNEDDEDEDEDEDEVYKGASNAHAQRIGSSTPNNIEEQELTVDFLEDDNEDEVERLGGDFEAAYQYLPFKSQDVKIGFVLHGLLLLERGLFWDPQKRRNRVGGGDGWWQYWCC